MKKIKKINKVKNVNKKNDENFQKNQKSEKLSKKSKKNIFTKKFQNFFFFQKYCRKLFWTKNIHTWTKKVEILKQLIFFCKMQRM